MFEESILVIVLLAITCIIRFSLAAIGYINPIWLMNQLGARLENNFQMSYIIRVWSIRDMVLSFLVLFSKNEFLLPLLIACLVIDITDVISAHLAGLAKQFTSKEVSHLKWTAYAAIIPESIALSLIIFKW